MQQQQQQQQPPAVGSKRTTLEICQMIDKMFDEIFPEAAAERARQYKEIEDNFTGWDDVPASTTYSPS